MSCASAVMCYEAIICPRCSSVSIVKNGKTAQRKQRYLCQDCRRQFIRDYTNLGCVGAFLDLVVPLTINGAGIRDIEPVLFLSTNTVVPSENFFTLYFHRFTTVKSNPCLASNRAGC